MLCRRRVRRRQVELQSVFAESRKKQIPQAEIALGMTDAGPDQASPNKNDLNAEFG